MLAVDPPRSAHKKLSILRRFSRRPSNECLSKTNNHAIYNQVIRPASRQHKVTPAALPTPPLSPTPSKLTKLPKSPTVPLSPTLSKNDSVLDLPRPPSPHLTKDKKYRKDRTITTLRVDIPQVVREHISRGSSPNSECHPYQTLPFLANRQSPRNDMGRLSAAHTSSRPVSWPSTVRHQRQMVYIQRRS
jgi:hypothetical protein